MNWPLNNSLSNHSDSEKVPTKASAALNNSFGEVVASLTAFGVVPHRWVLPLVVFFSLLAVGVGELSAQEGYEVHGLNFEGNITLADRQLQDQISTRATSGFRRSILGKDAFLFSQEILKSDLRRIERLYQQEGFLDVRAEAANLEINHKNQSIKISIGIIENAPILINDIRLSIIASPEHPAQVDNIDLSSVQGSLKAKTGERFRDSLLYQDQEALVRMFEDRGYPYTRAEMNLSVDPQLQQVDIGWQIEPGPRCHFGDITVVGLAHASENLIRKRLTFSSGDRYSRSDLEESQRRIYGLSIFHVVSLKAQLGSEQSSVVPLKISVDEAPRLSSRIGVGYGREEKFRIYSDFRLFGFIGGARQLNLYLKHSDLEPYHVRLKLRQPAFLTSYTNLELSPFLLRQREPAFDQVRYGGHVSLLHQLTAHLRGSATYLFERVDLDTTSLAESTFDAGRLEDLYQKSSIMFGLTFDDSQPIFSPDRGMYMAGAFTVSGLGLGSDYHYTRLLLDVRRYQQLLGLTLAARVKAGGIKSTDEPEFIPVEDRFYAGGSASVRGWARAELGPRDSKGTPVGGNTLFESSLEARIPIYGLVSGVLFYDFGNVWDRSYSLHLNDLRYSAGLGLRIKTPIGPIRFDIGWPVADTESSPQYHISVGEAF
ncbi:MAG: BamA/TamA family outer membrane protein [bacterium]|nr:BamA/TamA family outer membrane protein [bacterium]